MRFEGGAVTDLKIVKVADGTKLPTREELPDNDPKKWKEEDADGNPRDPWVKQWYLPLIGVESGDFVTFVTGSNGGNNAISNLCQVYGHSARDGLLPIVALKTGSYKHKKYGRIEEPDLPVVGWHGKPPGPETPTPAMPPDMGDPIPY